MSGFCREKKYRRGGGGGGGGGGGLVVGGFLHEVHLTAPQFSILNPQF